MAATHQAQDSAERVVSLQTEIVDEKNPSTSVNTKEQLISSKDDNIATSVARGASSVKSPKNAQGKAGSLGKGGEQQFVYQPPVYAPQPQTLFSGGFMNPSGQWEGYPHYVSVEGLDIASPGIYNENQSLMLSSGYANNPQMMYGSYSPVPTIGDGQPFFPMHYPFSNAYYQLPASPSMGYSNSATGMSQVDPMLQQEYFLPDGLLYSPTPGFHQQFGSFDGAPIQPSGAPGLFGQGSVPPTSGMHQGSIYGSGSYKARQQGGKFGGATPSWNATGRGFSTFDKGFKQEKGSISLDSQNLSLEFMNEQNRGPRATRPKKQDMENSLPEDKKEKTISVIDSELYNRPDFVTEYKEARFFVIKSYTEDHVHKSIKYGVWASTASGNRKLNSAYCEVKEKQDHCPIFLFFSVNGSGQFCGVAEMIGPVDFDKSVDYWQQDKWSGQFPVKWHIVKDVPNSLLRHIVLENNDNKPVTNSRDTQEVKLEQGLQMLTIFKNHEAETTVLEDFDFYEQREKAMQENRKQQRAITEAPKPSTLEAKVPGDLMIHISDSFARVVQLEETKNNGKKLEAEDATTAADAAAATSTATVETEGVPSTKNPLEESI